MPRDPHAFVEAPTHRMLARIEGLGRRWTSSRDVWLSGPRLAIVLTAVAAVQLASGFVSAFLLPLTSARLTRPTAALIPDFGPWLAIRNAGLPVPEGADLGPAVIAVAALPFVAYAIAILAIWGRPIGRRGLASIAGVALAFWLVHALAMPTYDTDIFNYISNGRVGAVHGANPHLVAATAFPDDPMLKFASPNYTSIPGDNKLPGWTLVDILLARLGGNDPVANLFLYRGFFFILDVANLVLIATVTRRLMPKLVPTAVLLYGWHPIVAAVGQSKVDTLMVTLLLGAALAISVGRRSVGIAGLAASSLVKLTTLPLLAMSLLQPAYHRSWRVFVVGGIVAAAVAAAVYLPFGNPLAILPEQAKLLGEGGSSAPAALRPLLYVGFGALIVWLAWRQDQSPLSTFRGWAILALYFGMFLTKIGFSWYLLPLISLAALTVSGPIVIGMYAVSFSSALFDAWFSYPLPPLLTVSAESAYFVPVFVIGCAIVVTVLVARARNASGSGKRGPDRDAREHADQQSGRHIDPTEAGVRDP